MNILIYISFFFLFLFLGVSLDTYRIVRRTQRLLPRMIDDYEAENSVFSRLEAESERETSTATTFAETITKDITYQPVPISVGQIEPIDPHLSIPETSTTIIICPPTLDGMVSAALLKSCYPWAEVRVIHKDYWVKSLWRMTKKSPKPDHIIIVGTDAGYVHGRRLIQTLQGLHDMGITIAWYDNHDWLPIIAKNISQYCSDFVLINPDFTTTELIQKRFGPYLTHDSNAIADVVNVPLLVSGPHSWTIQWNRLLRYCIEEGSGYSRTRLVNRLARKASLTIVDYYRLFQFSRKISLTREILQTQHQLVEMGSNLRLSIIDIRPIHREKSVDGKVYYVFRGRKPLHNFHILAFDDHDCQLVLVIHSLLKLELFRADNIAVKLTQLIDVTSIGGKPVHIDGRDNRVGIQLDIPFFRRFWSTFRFIWPSELSGIIEKIQERLSQ